MTETNVFRLSQPGTFTDPLTEVLRNGARALLAQAVEAEVATLLNCHADKMTDDGRRRLVRHGHLPEREIMTGIGPVAVRCPRVRDRVGRRGGSHPLFVGDLAALRAPLEEPRSTDPGALPQGHLQRRLRGGAGGAARQGRRRALGLDHRAAEGGMVGGAPALEQARSLGQALRLLLGRRHPRAGPSGRRGAVPAGHHRGHARRARRSSSASSTACARARNPGESCSST